MSHSIIAASKQKEKRAKQLDCMLDMYALTSVDMSPAFNEALCPAYQHFRAILGQNQVRHFHSQQKKGKSWTKLAAEAISAGHEPDGSDVLCPWMFILGAAKIYEAKGAVCLPDVSEAAEATFINVSKDRVHGYISRDRQKGGAVHHSICFVYYGDADVGDPANIATVRCANDALAVVYFELGKLLLKIECVDTQLATLLLGHLDLYAEFMGTVEDWRAQLSVIQDQPVCWRPTFDRISAECSLLFRSAAARKAEAVARIGP